MANAFAAAARAVDLIPASRLNDYPGFLKAASNWLDHHHRGPRYTAIEDIIGPWTVFWPDDSGQSMGHWTRQTVERFIVEWT